MKHHSWLPVDPHDVLCLRPSASLTADEDKTCSMLLCVVLYQPLEHGSHITFISLLFLRWVKSIPPSDSLSSPSMEALRQLNSDLLEVWKRGKIEIYFATYKLTSSQSRIHILVNISHYCPSFSSE